MSTEIEQLNDAERVVYDLVATPSVSGRERTAAEVFVRHACEFGFDSEIDEVGNALAYRGPADGVHIVLLGHIDTVPGHIPVRVENGVLHGRGSVDAKGPLAAMLVAASRAALPDGVRVSVIAAVGEETSGSPGARYLTSRLRPDACIIGEPSGWDGITLGYKGRLIITATAESAAAHSAGPDASPCDALFAWWAATQNEFDVFNADRSRAFDQVQSTIRDVRAHDDGLTLHATLEAGLRLPPDVDPHALAARLTATAPDGVALTCTGHEAAAVSSRNDAVARALCAGIRARGVRPRPKLKTGTADFNVVAPHWRCPIAAYGPGDSALDHTPIEHLFLDDYRHSIDVLTHAIGMLAEELAGTEVPLALTSVEENHA